VIRSASRMVQGYGTPYTATGKRGLQEPSHPPVSGLRVLAAPIRLRQSGSRSRNSHAATRLYLNKWVADFETTARATGKGGLLQSIATG